MTFRLGVKDAGATWRVPRMLRILPARPEKSGDRQFRANYSLSENMMVAEDEPWTVALDKIIPGKSLLTIKRDGTKKVRVVGCGNFQEDTGVAVFTVCVNVKLSE